MIGTLMTVQKIRGVYEVMSRRDLDATLSYLDEHAQLYFPGTIDGVSGNVTGRYELRQWFAAFFEQFPEIRFNVRQIMPENCFDLFGNNTVAVSWSIAVTNRDGVKIENDGVSLIEIRNGKVISNREYVFDTHEKFTQAWGQTPPAPTTPKRRTRKPKTE